MAEYTYLPDISVKCDGRFGDFWYIQSFYILTFNIYKHKNLQVLTQISNG